MRSDHVPERKPVSVEISLTNGSSLTGKAWVPTQRSLADALNGAQAFIEFMPYGDGRTHYLAKTSIAAIAAIDIPKVVPLHERRRAVDADDPHHILGVAPGAPWHVVREAYLRLAKTYHPDRFAGIALPNEVTEYLGLQARRINAAYAMLEDRIKHAAGANGIDTTYAAR